MERKFWGETAADALRKARDEMGGDLIILHSSKVKRGGFFGLLGKPMIELVVTNDKEFDRLLPRRNIKPSVPKTTLKKAYDSGKAKRQAAVLEREEQHKHIKTDAAMENRLWSSEISEIKSMIKEIQLQTKCRALPDYPNELLELYIHLVNNSVAEQMARGLIRRLQSELKPSELADKELVQKKLMEYLASLIETTGPIKIRSNKKPYVVALIGPTGVGKTTTVAKLAYNFSERHRYKTAIITIDQYRIAAVEQLRTYSRIMEIPFRSAQTPHELKECIAGFKGYDLVLVDTAGRSQRDNSKIDELKNFLDAIKPDETHLVLTCTAQPANIMEVLKNFAVFNFNHMILTKLDEAVDLGLVLTIMAKVRAGLSYVTIGQRVPGDILVGESDYLAKQIVCGRQKYD